MVLALTLGGATLAIVGLLRLRARGFHPMPRAVALASVAGGLVVVAFGVVLAFVQPGTNQPDDTAPTVTLEPQATDAGVSADDDPLDSSSEISGTVTDPDGDGVDGADVELVPLFERKGVEVRSTVTDGGGAFTFDDVAFDLGSPYVVEAVFDDTRFPSAVLRGPRGTDPVAEIVVAPATERTGDLQVQQESIAVIGTDAAVEVVHTLTIRNRGDRAYVGKVKLPLLPGASAIQEGGDLDRRLLDLGSTSMTSTKPVLPGRTEITYTYVIATPRAGIPLRRNVQLPTDRFVLLTSGMQARDARGLRDDGEVELQDTTYARASASDVGPSDDITARLVAGDAPDTLKTAAPIGAGVIALLLIAFGLIRKRRTS